MTEELYNKIDKFCNETDWSKYPTYEHALEDFIKRIVAEETKQLEKENAELKELLDCKNCCELEESECESCAEFGHFRCKGKAQLTKAKEIIKELMSFSVQLCDCRHTVDFEKTREEAEKFLSEVEK